MAQVADQIVVEVTAVTSQYNQAMVQVAAVTTRNMQAAEDAAKKSSEAIGKALETAASRVPGLVKGLAEGRGALQLFLGEAAELLPIFGPWGIALGAAAGALGAVLENFDLLTGRVRVSADELARMNAELEGTKGATAALEGGYDALIAKLATMSELQKEAFIISQETSLQNDLTELEKVIASTSGNIKDNLYDIRGQMLRTFGGTTEEAGRFARSFQTLLDTFADGKLPIEQYEEFRHMFEVLSVKATPEFQAVLKKLSDQLAVTGAQAEEFNKKKEQTAAVVDTTNGHFSESNRLLIDQRSNLADAGAAAEGYARAMREAGEAQLSFGRRSSRKGFVQLPPPEAGALANLPVQDVFGNVFQDIDIPNLKPDEASLRFLNSPKTVGGRGGGVAKQTEEQRAQNQQFAEAQRLYEQTLEPLEKYFQAQDRILSLHDALRVALGGEAAAQEVMNRALKQAADTYVEEQEKIDKTREKAEEAAKRQKELGDAVVAVGDVFKDGIKDAKDFNDALDKIGLSLLDLAVKGLFGQGALGDVFNQILGNPSGSAGIFGPGPTDAKTSADGGGGGGGGGLGSLIGSGLSWLVGLFGGALAGGGQALPGRLYQVGETGREWFAPSVPGQVIPNSVIRAAAGGGGSDQPITFNISMAGANGDRAIAEIAAAAVKKGLASVPEINRQHRIRFA